MECHYKNALLKKQCMYLCIVVSILVVIGLVFIYSASSVYAGERFGIAHYYLKQHLIGLSVSVCAFGIIQAVPFAFIRVYTPALFLVSLLLTLLTVISPWGVHIHGSSRWLALASFSFQPSELLKIGLILYLAQVLSKRERRSVRSLGRDMFPVVVALILTCSILLQQPDFGLTVTLIATTFIVLFVANFHLYALFAALASMVPLLLALIVMRPYRLKRIITFLDPWSDQHGAGFQIIQSLIAIGSGRWAGVGIAHSKQKFFYLPMQHTDFIFSIIAEETGFIGSLFIITLFVLFLYYGIRIARNLPDRFSLYATTGFVVLISLQALINIAVATGLAPTKGIGLPFISYGNSALLANFIMLGLISAMVREATATRPLEQYMPL
jgi:cell division protein FtsW